METKELQASSRYLFVFIIFVFLSVIPTSAKPITYIKEYTYQASEMDSKLSCRIIALEQVKRLLLEELGTYLISETAVKDFELTKDQILSFTAGIIKTVILDEKWDGKSYFLKAKITTETDELVKSIDDIRRNQEYHKHWAEMREKTGQALKEIERLRKGIDDHKGGKVGKEEYAKAVSELDAMNWFEKGYALKTAKKTKKNEEAIKAYTKAIEINPNYAQAYVGRAESHINLKQYQQALRDSEAAVKLDPKLPWAFNCLGEAHLGLGRYPQAVKDYNKAIELDPKYAMAYCNRSHAYFKLKDFSQALQDADEAVGLDPKLPHAYHHRGKAHDALKHYQDAIRNFDKAIELYPTFASSFFNRGRVFLKLDKREQALEDFKRAASLGNDEAQIYLKKKGIR